MHSVFTVLKIMLRALIKHDYITHDQSQLEKKIVKTLFLSTINCGWKKYKSDNWPSRWNSTWSRLISSRNSHEPSYVRQSASIAFFHSNSFFRVLRSSARGEKFLISGAINDSDLKQLSLNDIKAMLLNRFLPISIVKE